jgi:hypothetical protein
MWSNMRSATCIGTSDVTERRKTRERQTQARVQPSHPRPLLAAYTTGRYYKSPCLRLYTAILFSDQIIYRKKFRNIKRNSLYECMFVRK